LGAALILEQGYQAVRMELPDNSINALLAKKDSLAFEQVFKTHFKNLHGYAYTLVKDEIVAEEMVQNIFAKIWDRASDLNMTGSVAAYLYRAVHNESLNFIIQAFFVRQFVISRDEKSSQVTLQRLAILHV
jgi:RNA polymerase sigma-70 factor (ECF subfamily)